MDKNQTNSTETAIIIGAGPAGLTAAYELITRTNIKPIVLEMSEDIGGISKTINYRGNRMDIGGHRFFSKSDKVMNWWLNILPVQSAANFDSDLDELDISYQNKTTKIKLPDSGPDPVIDDRVMLVRNRLSRIYFMRSFFDYPIKLNKALIKKLGVKKLVQIMLSYVRARIVPIKPERTLQDFMINRFGWVLYGMFFRDYTQKVWGRPCSEISAEWGAQRIKGLSITKALVHSLKAAFGTDSSVAQKNTETSLIQRFLYPKYGPGQMWEEVARLVQERGGKLLKKSEVVGVTYKEGCITEVNVKNTATGDIYSLAGDYFFSTMPVRDLVEAFEMCGDVPATVSNVAKGLIYRDFITVGLLLKRLSVQEYDDSGAKVDEIEDNWIYIQEPDVRVGRVQIFNNWSPYLVKDKNTLWIGTEYFCDEGDSLWALSDEELKDLAIEEMIKIGFIKKEDVLDGHVIRVPKTYPAYFGSYDEFHKVRDFTDNISNLFLIGRNGMHKYNNQDHSMLTAMTAVDNIINGVATKENIWMVNTEMDYHEEQSN